MKHFYITLFFIVSFCTAGFAQNEFITTWETTTADESITIPTTGSGYNYTVDWGDGTIETGFTGNATHEYANASTHTVKITGDFPRIYFEISDDKDKILSIDQWGSIVWKSFDDAFRGCTELTYNATDVPNLSQVQSMRRMFNDCNSFNATNLNDWDVSNVSRMDFMFAGATVFNGVIGNWDVNKVTNFLNMFSNTSLFNQDISNWTINNNADVRMEGMFANAEAFNQPIGKWDVSRVISVKAMFRNSNAFDYSLASWDISNMTNMEIMFDRSELSQASYDATLIGWATLDTGETQIPMDIIFDGGNSKYCFGTSARDILTNGPFNWIITDQGQDCDFTNAFVTTWETTTADEDITIPTTGFGYNYTVDWGDGTIETGLTGNATHEYAVADMYTVKIIGDFPRIYFDNTAIDRNKILTIEQWGKIQWTSMQSAFYGCSRLKYNATDAPDLSGVQDMARMFNDCNLFDAEDLTGWDVSNVTNMGFMFSGATVFDGDITNWNVSKVTNFLFTFNKARAFNQDISGWIINTNAPVNMIAMFRGASVFDQPIGKWDVSRVTSISRMFEETTTLDQSLGDWDLTNITDMTNMFTISGLSGTNYDKTLMGWALDSSGNTNDGIDDIPTGITLNAGRSQYCLGTDARNTLTDISGLNWSITDQGQDCDFTNAFVTTWQTTTVDESITIPTTGDGYNFAVDWGDGAIEIGFTGNATHEYTTAGTYTVRIIGDFPRIYFNNSGNKDKILSVEQWGSQQWSSMQAAFFGCSKLVLNATDIPDLGLVTSMAFVFQNTTSFIDNGGEIGNWEVGTVEFLSKAFKGSAFNENINNWDVSKVKSAIEAFQNAASFNQPLNNWNLTSARLLRNMFKDAVSFNQNLGNWDISNVSSFGLSGLLNNSGMSTSNYDATLIGWATLDAGETQIPTGVTLDASATFCFAEEARNTLTSTLYNWIITDGGQNCTDAFITSWLLEDNDEIEIRTNSAYNYKFNIDWGDGTKDTNVTTDISHVYPTAGTYKVSITGEFPRFTLFFRAGRTLRTKIQTIEQWGNIQWRSFRDSFNGCVNLKLNADDTPDLSQVTDLSSMFESCTNFEDLKDQIGNWDLTTIRDINSMFEECTIFNENIGGWTFTVLEDTDSTFEDATSFNQNISGWNVSTVLDFTEMFQGATSFNQPIGSWTLGTVDYLAAMFRDATAFNQDLSSWDVSNSFDIRNMFEGAGSFDQDLSAWDISNVDALNNFFSGSGMSTENYDKTLIGWATLEAGETTIPGDLTLNADATFCLAEGARDTLTGSLYNWIINDGGFGCPTPVITLLGDNPQTITLGDMYTEPGAEVTHGAVLTIDISDVDINLRGMYSVTYNATSASGEIAAQVTRIVNVIDSCPIVNLPENNFTLTTASETCVDKNNGIISISATEPLNYIATINNETYNFTSSIVIPDLTPDIYSFCITIDGITGCEQCFELTIEEAAVVTGKTTLDLDTMNVEMASGTAPYMAMINDKVVGEYTSNTFAVKVQHGDVLDVVSSLACEGKLSARVDLFDKITITPNPTQGDVILTVPNGGETMNVTIHNALGMMVSSGVYSIINSKVNLPMESLSAGIYFVRIEGSVSEPFKIVKQ
ncbi:BspA family leucine-rich repeat surface protein [Aquimarina algiphila]|uniref:BspA family leucine-rich repeat surface protein n=1 Tax=Aquimarina algiphila TaxID=2047982 RepID=UPI0024923017|nr:BspA family leucine-rich repeat surface protein [Aquimarina algiphila]